MLADILELFIVNDLFKVFFLVHTILTDIQKREQSPVSSKM